MATAVRSNSMPQGGPAAQQPVPAAQTPADIQAVVDAIPQPTLVRFRAQSSPLSVPLLDMTLTVGQQSQIQIANVGLGYRTTTKHVAVFTVNNSAGVAQTLVLGRTFPWSLIPDTTVAINGGATVYTCSGYGGLLVYGRTRNGFFGQDQIAGTAVGLSSALVSVTFGTGLTPTSSSLNLCGTSSVSVAAGTVATSNLTVTWYTFEKLAYDRATLLGALPLQNNSTYATLSRTFAASLTAATGNVASFNQLGANTTVTLVSYKASTTYDFWSVPSDPSLYADMIANSYQCIEARSLTVSATGTQALVYNLPQNHYLIAGHTFGFDNNNAWLVPLSTWQNYQIQYNAGSVIPVNREIGRTLAQQFADYNAMLGDLPGYLLWDGSDTVEDVTSSDQAGWIDCYSTANPQFKADLQSATVVPITYSFLRESIVAGAVSVIGG